MKKIAIVGKGTVGVLALTHFLRWTDWEIDWIYDPSIETTPVGEGTTLNLPAELAANIGFDHNDMNMVNATPKIGILKRGWGNGNEFLHPFPSGSTGMHMDALQLQDYLYQSLSKNRRVQIVERNISNPDELDCDHVMVCTGTPITDDEYDVHHHIPVNAASVYQCPWEFPKFLSSLTFAMKHGWVFGIPLKNRCAIGYVHNSNLTTREEIDEDVQSILDEFKLVPSTTRHINFKNYSRKVNYSKRVVYNGNASFFLEPLEATSTACACIINKYALDVWNNELHRNLANYRYKRDMSEVEGMMSLHYFSGSVYDSKFWEMAPKLASDKIVNEFINRTDFYRMINYGLKYSGPADDQTFGRAVGTWGEKSFSININKLGIRDKLLALMNT